MADIEHETFTIGATITVRFHHCGHCGKSFAGVGLVSHLVQEHSDWLGARRALRNLHKDALKDAQRG